MATVILWLRRSRPTIVIIDNDLIRYLFARDELDQ